MLIEDVVCPFCGCLCDDIKITVEDGNIVKVGGGDIVSKDLFLNYGKNLAKPTIRGKEVTPEAAIQEAATILAASHNPLIYGLSSSPNEAVQQAVALADLLGGNIDTTSSVCHAPGTLATQAEGIVTCTLGNIKNQADLVVFWGCNPVEAHPRHLQRYSGTAKGEYLPNGRKDRTLITVDVRRSLTAKVSDHFIQIEPNGDYACLSALRALLKGEKLNSNEVGGVPVEELVDLVEKLKTCRFGVIFYGMGLTMTHGKHLNVEGAINLVRELNHYTKFCVMPMRGHYNVTGADGVLLWQTGYPYAVNFGRGFPQFGPGEFSSVDLLARKEVDAAVIIASDPVSHFPRQASETLEEIPTIVLDPKLSRTSKIATVVIPTAETGIEAEGTAYRMDTVPIRLRKFMESHNPKDEEVLKSIIHRLKANSVAPKDRGKEGGGPTC